MSATKRPLVPLESGDRLTRTEFHRRYCARPDIKKAELIEGVVYVASPVSGRHGKPHGAMVGWLHAYAARTPGVELRVDTTVLLPGENEVQPDAFLFRMPPPLGGAYQREDGYVEGVPQLVVEIAVSSAAHDLHDKLALYERAGVLEYVVWEVYENRLRWFRLQDGRYVAVEPDEHGSIVSEALPGLRLPVPNLLAGDDAAVLDALQAPPSQRRRRRRIDETNGGAL